MRRRTFLHLSGIGALGALAGCAEARTLVTDAGPTSEADATPTPDAPPRSPDAASAPDAGAGPFVITTVISVFLNDPSCSGHDHGFSVSPGTFDDDTPLSFLGGSHLVAFRPSELLRIAAGEQLPFATIGPGPGHGHCGLAWLAGLYTPSRDRIDACTPMSPAEAPPALCEIRPRV